MNTGIWIMTEVTHKQGNRKCYTLTCSECGKVIYHVRYPFKYHFCSNCGAKMDIIKRDGKRTL